jgi:hypothetical protein
MTGIAGKVARRRQRCASNAAGHSKPVTLSFIILRG